MSNPMERARANARELGDVPAQLAALETMSVGQLAEKWRELYGEPTRTRNKDYLKKRLAWRIQELAEGGLPPGAVALPGGEFSIPVSSVSLPERLVIDEVEFTPNPVKSRDAVLELRVHVVDTRGYAVRDALVFARSTPVLTSPAGGGHGLVEER